MNLTLETPATVEEAEELLRTFAKDLNDLQDRERRGQKFDPELIAEAKGYCRAYHTMAKDLRIAKERADAQAKQAERDAKRAATMAPRLVEKARLETMTVEEARMELAAAEDAYDDAQRVGPRNIAEIIATRKRVTAASFQLRAIYQIRSDRWWKAQLAAGRSYQH